MEAEIIAVGSELLTPQRVDTNSLWLTQQLNAIGIEVTQKSVVGDDRNRLASTIAAALTRSAVVVLTGGLGPTEDDITREAAAKALSVELVFSDELMAALEARYARLGRKMAANNRKQAFLVSGAEPLPNPNGTAAGQWIETGGRVLLLLPGPPRELRPMVADHCLPRLASLMPPRAMHTLVYRVAGMPESELDQRIAPIYGKFDNPRTTILAKEGDIQIHLAAHGTTMDEAVSAAQKVGDLIVAELGDRIYSNNGDTLEAALGRLLAARAATLAVAESCTGGQLGAAITSVPGSSNWFLGGFQVYGKGMKTRLLGLDEPLVETHGVVSEAVAVAMAESARDRTGSTYGLSITGEAGPEASNPAVDPGTVWIGLASPSGAWAKQFRFNGDRARVRNFAVHTAMNLLRLHL